MVTPLADALAIAGFVGTLAPLIEEHDLAAALVSHEHAYALNLFLQREGWERAEAEGVLGKPPSTAVPTIDGAFRGSVFSDVEIQQLLATTFNGYVGRVGSEPKCKSE